MYIRKNPSKKQIIHACFSIRSAVYRLLCYYIILLEVYDCVQVTVKFSERIYNSTPGVMTHRVHKIFFCVLRNYIPFEETAAADGPACIPRAVPS